MKSTGILRPVDALGRVVVPMEIRNTFDIKTKDLLEIYVQGDKIILKKHSTSCSLCGNDSGEMVDFEDKKICKHCINKIAELNK